MISETVLEVQQSFLTSSLRKVASHDKLNKNQVLLKKYKLNLMEVLIS